MRTIAFLILLASHRTEVSVGEKIPHQFTHVYRAILIGLSRKFGVKATRGQVHYDCILFYGVEMFYAKETYA